MAQFRCLPAAGHSTPMRSTACFSRRCTFTRARSTLEPTRRARPSRPKARDNSAVNCSISSRAASAAGQIVVALRLLELLAQRFQPAAIFAATALIQRIAAIAGIDRLIRARGAHQVEHVDLLAGSRDQPRQHLHAPAVAQPEGLAVALTDPHFAVRRPSENIPLREGRRPSRPVPSAPRMRRLRGTARDGPPGSSDRVRRP